MAVKRPASLVTEAALSAEERRRTAYRESGHALVRMLTAGADPVREISIIPRCQTLGVSSSAPDADHLDYERDELEAKIRVALAGTCAEELVFGRPATDAKSALRQSMTIARQIVGRWGLSVTSQRLLVVVDDEVRRIVEEGHAAVLALLSGNRWRLDALAAALLRYEALDESTAHAAAGLPEPGSAPGSLTTAAFGSTSAAA